MWDIISNAQAGNWIDVNESSMADWGTADTVQSADWEQIAA
jgi:hypothetical protein